MLPIADQLFKAKIQYGVLQDAIITQMCEVLGITDADDWPFDDVTFDQYDSSFEFKQCKLGFELTTVHLQKFWDMGFARCWLCYLDKSEKYYDNYNTNPKEETK